MDESDIPFIPGTRAFVNKLRIALFDLIQIGG